MLPQKFRIPCQHFPPLVHVIGSVVGGSDFVVVDMGKLPFDCVGVVSLLVQRAACKAAEAVDCGAAFVAHPLDDTR